MLSAAAAAAAAFAAIAFRSVGRRLQSLRAYVDCSSSARRTRVVVTRRRGRVTEAVRFYFLRFLSADVVSVRRRKMTLRLASAQWINVCRT